MLLTSLMIQSMLLSKSVLASAAAVTGEFYLLGLTSDWLKLRRESLREGGDGRVGWRCTPSQLPQPTAWCVELGEGALGDVAVQVRIANPLLLVQSIHLQVQVQSIHAPPDPDSCPTFSSLLQALD